MEHVSCIRNIRNGSNSGTLAEIKDDLGEDCGGDHGYIIRVRATISGAHLKKVRKARIPVAKDIPSRSALAPSRQLTNFGTTSRTCLRSRERWSG